MIVSSLLEGREPVRRSKHNLSYRDGYHSSVIYFLIDVTIELGMTGLRLHYSV